MTEKTELDVHEYVIFLNIIFSRAGDQVYHCVCLEL